MKTKPAQGTGAFRQRWGRKLTGGRLCVHRRYREPINIASTSCARSETERNGIPLVGT